MEYKIIEGNLITLALAGEFEVIAQGVNCWNAQGAGISGAMVKAFRTDNFRMEQEKYMGDINKLGTIDHKTMSVMDESDENYPYLTIVNCYTQYNPGTSGDYEALTLCMRKINRIFKGRHIGLPLIGCGIAGLCWQSVEEIILNELIDLDVTIVRLPQNNLDS